MGLTQQLLLSSRLATPPCLETSGYLATRRFDSATPIWLKVVTIWFAEVSRKKWSVVPGELLAQFCRSDDVASPTGLTWIVMSAAFTLAQVRVSRASIEVWSVYQRS